MGKRPQAGTGDVLLVIDGEDRRLVPTYYAARTISRWSGGISGAVQRVIAVDIDAIEKVIGLGLGYDDDNNRPPKDFGDKLWRTGYTDTTGGLCMHAVAYLRILMQCGQPDAPKTTVEGAEGSPQ